MKYYSFQCGTRKVTVKAENAEEGFEKALQFFSSQGYPPGKYNVHTIQTTPLLIEQQTFTDWFKSAYQVTIVFDGNSVTAPPLYGGRSQGRTVALAANVAWAAWQKVATERDQAVRALISAGYTLKSGAKEWKPPVRPSVSPLLDRIDDLRSQREELLETLKHHQEQTKPLLDQIDDLRSQREELLETLKHHQEQTKPLQRTIDVINKLEQQP